MKIKWKEDTSLWVIHDFNEKTENANDGEEVAEKDAIDEVDILEDKGDVVDMQFGNGAVAFNVNKDYFEVIKE